jgi:hypothetical protein
MPWRNVTGKDLGTTAQSVTDIYIHVSNNSSFQHMNDDHITLNLYAVFKTSQSNTIQCHVTTQLSPTLLQRM